MNTVQVRSEIAPLRRILIHRPNAGIERLRPDEADEALYDDIVDLRLMREEHEVLTGILSAFVGPENVLEFADLLREVAEDETGRLRLLEGIAALRGRRVSQMVSDCQALSGKELADWLICGGEVPYALLPLPNLIFTRDIGTVLGDHLLVAHAAKRARRRESVLATAVFRHHPAFVGTPLIEADLNDPRQTVEGGDLMQLAEGLVLVASSERSSPEGLKPLVRRLLDTGIAEKVLFVHLPAKRSWMHLDTLLTRINERDFVGFAPLICTPGVVPVELHETGHVRTYASVERALQDLIPGSRVIPAGGGESPWQEREQWTDGCNLVALAPGLALAYDRNPRTTAALEAVGYHIHSAKEILATSPTRASLLDLAPAILTLPSAELARARGGPHCLTMPLQRG